MSCLECGAPAWVQTLIRPRPQRLGPLRYESRWAKVHRFIVDKDILAFWHFTDEVPTGQNGLVDER